VFVHTVVLFMRVLLLLFCLETSVRFLGWWRKTKEPVGGREFLLSQLMLGIFVVQAGMVFTTAWGIAAAAGSYPGAVSLTIASSLLVLIVGTALHLTPAWRITHGMSEGQIAVSLVARIAFALTVSLAVAAVT
jgi:hypothetical protein